jgi:hypothetical protein
MVGSLADCLSDRSLRVGIGVEERSGHARAAGDGGDADRGLLPAQPCDRVVDAAKRSRANSRYALTNSFGIGGNNVAVVFGAY